MYRYHHFNKISHLSAKILPFLNLALNANFVILAQIWVPKFCHSWIILGFKCQFCHIDSNLSAKILLFLNLGLWFSILLYWLNFECQYSAIQPQVIARNTYTILHHSLHVDLFFGHNFCVLAPNDSWYSWLL